MFFVCLFFGLLQFEHSDFKKDHIQNKKCTLSNDLEVQNPECSFGWIISSGE